MSKLTDLTPDIFSKFDNSALLKLRAAGVTQNSLGLYTDDEYCTFLQKTIEQHSGIYNKTLTTVILKHMVRAFSKKKTDKVFRTYIEHNVCYLNQIFEEAIKYPRLVIALIKEDGIVEDYELSNIIINVAAKYNNKSVLEYILADRRFDKATIGGKFALYNKLDTSIYEKIFEDTKIMRQVFNAAAEGGKIDILNYIYSHVDKTFFKDTSSIVLSLNNGHFDAYEWALEHVVNYEEKPLTKPYSKIGEHGTVAFLKKKLLSLKTKIIKPKWIDDIYYGASKSGNIDMIKYLSEKRSYMLKADKNRELCVTMTRNAVKCGNLEMLKYLDVKGYFKFFDESYITEDALRSGNVHILNWLVEKKLYSPDQIHNTRAATGSLDTIKWLHKMSQSNWQYETTWSAQTPDDYEYGVCPLTLVMDAVSTNNMELLKFANENGYNSGFSDIDRENILDAIYKYASYDILEASKVMDIDTEPSTKMCSNAIEKGRLDLLKRAVEKGYNVPSDSFQTASIHGHLGIAKWLFETFKITDSMKKNTLVCAYLANRGYFAFLKWAHTTAGFILDKRCIQTHGNKEHINEWLKEQGITMSTTSVVLPNSNRQSRSVLVRK